jgi:photosystem II stability/assembly factor-like uncharacterized protein
MAEQYAIGEFSRADKIAAKQGRGDAFHLTTHKARSIWYRDNAAWPTLEASVQRLVSERRRVRRTLQTAPGAGNWEAVGPTNIGGRMTAIVCHPQHAEIIWAGAAGGGVWHSTDAGQTWQALWHDQESLNVGSLAIDPRNPDVLYCGTGESNLSADSYPGVGLYRSTNGGRSWRLLARARPQGIPSRISAIAIDPFDSQHLLLGGVTHRFPTEAQAGGLGGIYESTDGGNTWHRLEFISMFDYRCHAISFHPLQQGRIYVTVSEQGSKNGIWRSTDGGQLWEHLANGLPAADLFDRTSLAIAPSNPDVLYALAADGDSGVLGLFRTDNGGDTWQAVHGTGFTYQRMTVGGFADQLERQMTYNNTIAVHPTNPDHIVCGGVDIHLSTDGGRTWTDVTNWDKPLGDPNYAHADQHALLMPASPPGRVYAVNDGGMDVSDDGGQTWTNRSNGLMVTMFYDYDVAPSNGRFQGGGAQDNGTPITQTGEPDDFRDFTDGDGGWIVFHPHNEAHLFVSSQFGRIVRHRPGEGWREVSPNFDRFDTPPWMVFIAIDPSTPSTLFTGTNRVWRTTTDGDVWEAVSRFFKGTISAIEIAAVDPQRIYVGTSFGSIHRSTDGGHTWSGNLESAILPGFKITRIKASPANADHVILTVANFGRSHVFRSVDGARTWEDVDRGQLPDVPHNSIAIPERFPQEVYVANDVGVFVSHNFGGTWANLTRNLPNVMAVDLVYHTGDNTLTVATYGRSAWRLKVR